MTTAGDPPDPVCAACDQPITDEPCYLNVHPGHTEQFHPDCCPECQENE